MITDYQEMIRNEVSMYHWYGMDGPWNRCMRSVCMKKWMLLGLNEEIYNEVSMFYIPMEILAWLHEVSLIRNGQIMERICEILWLNEEIAM